MVPGSPVVPGITPLVTHLWDIQDPRGGAGVAMALRGLREVAIYQSIRLNCVKLPMFNQLIHFTCINLIF